MNHGWTVLVVVTLAALAASCMKADPLPDRQDGSADVDTDADGDADTDSDTDGDSDLQCTAGICCDVENQTFQSSGYPCASATEYRCNGEECGADAQERVITTYCSGSTATACDGSVFNGAWSTIEGCGEAEQCSSDEAAYAQCGASQECECTSGGNLFDPESGLCWQNPAAAEPMQLDSAAIYCDSLETGGHADWFLPGIEVFAELINVTDLGSDEYVYGDTCEESATCTALFGVNTEDCWSATVVITDVWAWAADFSIGKLYWSSIDSGGAAKTVRCVRGGT